MSYETKLLTALFAVVAGVVCLLIRGDIGVQPGFSALPQNEQEAITEFRKLGYNMVEEFT